MPPRLAVLGDIHGNLPALEAVLADARAQGGTGYLLTGDLAARAPFPLETLQCLQSLPVLGAIRGNVDQYQIDFAQHGAPEDVRHNGYWELIKWTDQALGAKGVAYLASLPPEQVLHLSGFPPLRLVHEGPAGIRSPFLIPEKDAAARGLFLQSGLWPKIGEPPRLSQLIQRVSESLLICAHTHIPWQERVGECLVINPGSVGLPLNGDPRAQYALLSWQAGAWQVEQRTLDYDWQALKHAYQSSGLLAAGKSFARACLATALSGQNVVQRFAQHGWNLEKQFGISADTWRIAGDSFPWAQFGG